jgi:hydrogenase maturation factor
MCLAVPGKIISIEGDDPILRAGKVNFGGVIKQVNLSYVPALGARPAESLRLRLLSPVTARGGSIKYT